MFHLHGLGTAPSVTKAAEWLRKSASAGSLQAKSVLIFLLTAQGLPVHDDAIRAVLDDLLRASYRLNNRRLSQSLCELRPEAYRASLEDARTRWLDLLDSGAQHEIVTGTSSEGQELKVLIVGKRDANGIEEGLPLQLWLSVLQQAVLFQSLQQVRDVLQTGTDVNETRISGHTALWLAL